MRKDALLHAGEKDLLELEAFGGVHGHQLQRVVPVPRLVTLSFASAGAIAAGGTGGSLFTLDPRQQGQTMTAAMTALATGSDQVKGAALAFPSLFFVGALLFFMTLALNVMSERFVRRVRRRY